MFKLFKYKYTSKNKYKIELKEKDLKVIKKYF